MVTAPARTQAALGDLQKCQQSGFTLSWDITHPAPHGAPCVLHTEIITV
ncbi:hypothetical protein [Vibrio parahaemolyticus]|nr:hypothetical protein [Vibrio parahaemolyticus]MDF4820352.1 hypothetical protein [Vibrio parahaemolyticus]UJW92768.1 hypothetical protein JHS83_25415 [Vibrio parahaemolyticus]UJX06933.1 hypothetical protein JHS88_25065 [Vibrio parahaemolyticus]UJX07007.1 hypothetical protein JHS88_25525 [Vibrio parahaemolyticus]WCZ09846.1 hypothetical protein GSR97_26745 [Vibrio parahaemolyticus]